MAAERVERLDVSTYRVPTEAPESDGTLTWDATTVVVVQVAGGGATGLGFTYSTDAAAAVVADHLRDVVVGTGVLDVAGTWSAMVRAIRNLGRPGVVSAAIAAVDVALWDLKANVLGLPLADLLGRARESVAVYGSGGFTGLSEAQLCDQLTAWVADGIGAVKMKIGTDWGAEPDRDVARVAAARRAIGDHVELFVDANGAYTRKQAVRLAERFAELGVTWFEEPVSSDDLDGLRLISSATPIDVAAGEYGWDLVYFSRMCAAGAVDVLQADVSRCAGITEWMRVAAVAAANGLDISGHCAQSLHAPVACSVPNVRHLEYFHDHQRVDRLLFDGVLDPAGGRLHPAGDVTGLGVRLRPADAEQFLVCRRLQP